jgi:ATP-dependent Clp protease protease subunit
MGAFLLSAGTKGKRFALPECRIMCHQPSGGLGRSTVTDLKIHLDEIERTKEQLTRHLANHCNKSYQEVYDMCERDTFFSSQEALEYGIIDEVISNRKK